MKWFILPYEVQKLKYVITSAHVENLDFFPTRRWLYWNNDVIETKCYCESQKTWPQIILKAMPNDLGMISGLITSLIHVYKGDWQKSQNHQGGSWFALHLPKAALTTFDGIRGRTITRIRHLSGRLSGHKYIVVPRTSSLYPLSWISLSRGNRV